MSKIFKILPGEVWDIITSPYKTDWKGIIFHHTAFYSRTAQGEFIEHMHGEGGRVGYPAFRYGMGYHFLVNWDGTIEVGQRWPRQIHGAHCLGKNKTHIGMAFAGNLMLNELSDKQINSAVNLLFYIGRMVTDVHSSFSDTLCPGKNFPFLKIKDLVIILRAENKIRSDAIKRRPIYCKSLTKEDV